MHGHESACCYDGGYCLFIFYHCARKYHQNFIRTEVNYWIALIYSLKLKALFSVISVHFTVDLMTIPEVLLILLFKLHIYLLVVKQLPFLSNHLKMLKKGMSIWIMKLTEVSWVDRNFIHSIFQCVYTVHNSAEVAVVLILCSLLTLLSSHTNVDSQSVFFFFLKLNKYERARAKSNEQNWYESVIRGPVCKRIKPFSSPFTLFCTHKVLSACARAIAQSFTSVFYVSQFWLVLK